MRIRPAIAPANAAVIVLRAARAARLGRALALSLGVGLAMVGTSPDARAQDIALGGIKATPGAPVTVTSDQLNVDQTTGVALFTGNVVVVQEGLRMNADKVTVDYLPGDSTQIKTMTADGHVVLVSPTEAAEGNHAVYDVPGGTVVMTGDVLLTQGPNIISGPKLTVDLRTSTGHMDGGGGRVKTVLQPGAKGAAQ
ncbi:MAG TPA: lipopolysaccharide transport periplasmic protein LptA [Paenirhodobacter sp.]